MNATAGRRLNWAGLIATLLICLVAPAIVELLWFTGVPEGMYPDGRSIAALVIGTGVEVALAVVVITWLRWWPPVLHERLRVRPWLWALPIVMLAAPIALTDYAQLGRSGWGLILGLALGCLLIGAGEELLFRGVTLTFTRARYREWIAALVTTALFAAFHLPGGVLVAVGAGLTGALLYVVRRVSGGIILPIVAHAVWDFAVYSGYLGPDPASSSTASQVLFLLSLGLVIVIAVTHRWWRITPTRAESTSVEG